MPEDHDDMKFMLMTVEGLSSTSFYRIRPVVVLNHAPMFSMADRDK